MPERDEASMRALATKMFDCVENDDWDGFVACFAPDAQVWNNTDQRQVTPKEMVEILVRLNSTVTGKRYERRQLNVFAGGFVQRHMLCGTRKTDGQRVEVPACLIGEVADGMVTRTYDYVDSVTVGQLGK
jgi:ketosteroid isomerase-like protein